MLPQHLSQLLWYKHTHTHTRSPGQDFSQGELRYSNHIVSVFPHKPQRFQMFLSLRACRACRPLLYQVSPARDATHAKHFVLRHSSEAVGHQAAADSHGSAFPPVPR